MATKAQMGEVQKSLKKLLEQNEEMADKIEVLEKENRVINKGSGQ